MDSDKILECYKVVRIDEYGNRVSATVSIHPYCITYYPGRAIRALSDTLGCMAFRTLEAARRFRYWNLEEDAQTEIWKCDLTNPRTPGWILGWRNDSTWLESILDLLTGADKGVTLRELAQRETWAWAKFRLRGDVLTGISMPPSGTVCGDSLRLTAVVEVEKPIR